MSLFHVFSFDPSSAAFTGDPAAHAVLLTIRSPCPCSPSCLRKVLHPYINPHPNHLPLSGCRTRPVLFPQCPFLSPLSPEMKKAGPDQQCRGGFSASRADLVLPKSQLFGYHLFPDTGHTSYGENAPYSPCVQLMSNERFLLFFD